MPSKPIANPPSRARLATMPPPRKPSPVPTLLPFIVMALILLVIYLGVLLFPKVQDYVRRQDCIATGRTNCDPRS